MINHAMPYYYDCITYYSPSASLTQMVYAFVVGLVIAFMIHAINTKENPIPPVEDANPAGLQTQLDNALALVKSLEGQRDRAFQAAIAILIVAWLATSFAMVSRNSSANSPYQAKTEL
jgi:hypothetical protein